MIFRVYAYIHSYVGQRSYAFSNHFPSYILKQNLSLNLELTAMARWPAIWGSACLYLNEVHSHAWLVTWVLKIWTQILTCAWQTLHPSPIVWWIFRQTFDILALLMAMRFAWVPTFQHFPFIFIRRLGNGQTVVARSLSWKICGHILNFAIC